jgi:nucleoside-diphosphate-sugar epimerase
MTPTGGTVLVTGATGAIGPSVVSGFREAGFRVRALLRDRARAEMFPADVQVCFGDITDSLAVQSAMEGGVDLVVHMAALLHLLNPSEALRPEYERINVGGTVNVVKSAAQLGVRRVVFFSTIAVYGRGSGEIVTEHSPVRPETFYAQTKLAAERIVLAATGADGQPLGTVLRLAAVYGPRIKGNYRRLLLSLAKHRFIKIGKGLNRRTLVYDRDVASAAVLAAGHAKAAGQVYNVSDGQFHTLNEIVSKMCAALGRVPPRISLPIGPVHSAARLSGNAARLIGLNLPLAATVEKYSEEVTVSSQLIQTQLGFSPRFNLAGGWQETVREMRSLRDLPS